MSKSIAMSLRITPEQKKLLDTYFKGSIHAFLDIYLTKSNIDDLKLISLGGDKNGRKRKTQSKNRAGRP